MSKIPLNLLEAFITFNDSRNMQEASQKLQITQPALTKQLQLLQSYLPETLYTLTGRKKTLTHFGRVLHISLKDRIGSLHELVQQASVSALDPQKIQIRISSRRGLLNRISAQLNFSGTLTFLESSNEKSIQDLQDLKTDLALTYTTFESHDFIARPLFQEQFQIAVPKKWKLSSKKINRMLIQLQGQPCLSFKLNDELLEQLCRYHNISHQNLKIPRITSDYNSLAAMVESNLGWALLPSYLILDKSKATTYIINSDVFPQRKFYALYRKDYHKLPWFQQLLQDIETCFQ